MDRIEALAHVVAVADQGGFARAARTLGVSPPAVTRSIAALEAHLGAMLFHRSTRAVSLTDAGAAFVVTARRILADMDEAERQVRGTLADPAGLLHVTAPVLFGRLHVLPVVAELLDQHAALTIRLLLVDRTVRLVEEGIDIAVRIGPLPDSSLKATRIGAVRQVIVASPAYLARHGAPGDPADIANHAVVASSGPRGSADWQFAGGVRPVTPGRVRLSVNTVAATLAAAEAGVGIANLLSYQVDAALAAGRLVELLPGHAPPALPVHLVFDASRTAGAASRAFIDAMRARAQDQGWRDGRMSAGDAGA